MKTITKPEWGPWKHDGECIWTDEPYQYVIALDQCTTSSEVLDWLCQIAGKTWGDDACLGGLLRIFNDVLQPQGTMVHQR